ncbi:MAG: 4Fe-4S binding protein [Clostridia bacterium]|nr:4Fe-4S binding protein [Clostridia bacterium]
MFGKGLIKGLGVTLGWFFRKKVTVQYPDETLEMFPRYHGRFQFDSNKCIACSLCANACPNKVIKIGKAKLGKKQIMISYTMNIEYCLFCGLCVESCPKGALSFSNVINMNQYFRDRVALHLFERPAPTPEEIAAAEAAEAEAAAKKAAEAEKAAQADGKEG